MSDIEVKNESHLDGDLILNKLDKLTSCSSPRVPTIKDFAIIKPISRGAFGKVFLGYKVTNASKLFAIKVSPFCASAPPLSMTLTLFRLAAGDEKIGDGQQKYDFSSDNGAKCVGADH